MFSAGQLAPFLLVLIKARIPSVTRGSAVLINVK